jgi:hypothetical protein
MGWKTLDDMDLAGKRVLVRVDINVPVEDGRVTDATRIERIVPTVKDILAKGGKPILLAHFDRPKGKVVPEMSLRVTLPALEAALGQPVTFVDGQYGAAVAAMGRGDVLLLENLRFNPGEEKNDPAFAARLATLGDVYCNDAFSAAHRAHASTEAIARLLPSCAGRLMAEELARWKRRLGTRTGPSWRLSAGPRCRPSLISGQSGHPRRSSGDRWWHGQHLPGRPRHAVGKSLASTIWPTPRARFWPRPRRRVVRSSCRRTSWWPANSRPMPRTDRRCGRLPCRCDDPRCGARDGGPDRRCSKGPRPSSGTARLARSRWSPSRRRPSPCWTPSRPRQPPGS